MPALFLHCALALLQEMLPAPPPCGFGVLMAFLIVAEFQVIDKVVRAKEHGVPSTSFSDGINVCLGR